MKKLLIFSVLFCCLLVSVSFAEEMKTPKWIINAGYSGVNTDNFNSPFYQIALSNDMTAAGYYLIASYYLTDQIFLGANYVRLDFGGDATTYAAGFGPGGAYNAGSVTAWQDIGQVMLGYMFTDSIYVYGKYGNSTSANKWAADISNAFGGLPSEANASAAYAAGFGIQKMMLPFIPYVMAQWSECKIFGVLISAYDVSIGTMVGISPNLPLLYLELCRSMANNDQLNRTTFNVGLTLMK